MKYNCFSKHIPDKWKHHQSDADNFKHCVLVAFFFTIAIASKKLDYSLHCLKSVRNRSFSGPYFPAFGLNMKRYSVPPRIQSECGKIWTRKTPNTDTFHAVLYYSVFRNFWRRRSKLINFLIALVHDGVQLLVNINYVFHL